MARVDHARAGLTVRCAIYTRKSSDEGLDQEFNSLDAQREACEAYIVSQRHAGWIAMFSMKDTSMAACANAAFQLVAACAALNTLAAVNSEHTGHLAKTVEMICNDCKKECDKFPKITECKDCSDACKACADECQKVGDAAQSGPSPPPF